MITGNRSVVMTTWSSHAVSAPSVVTAVLAKTHLRVCVPAGITMMGFSQPGGGSLSEAASVPSMKNCSFAPFGSNSAFQRKFTVFTPVTTVCTNVCSPIPMGPACSASTPSLVSTVSGNQLASPPSVQVAELSSAAAHLAASIHSANSSGICLPLCRYPPLAAGVSHCTHGKVPRPCGQAGSRRRPARRR